MGPLALRRDSILGWFGLLLLALALAGVYQFEASRGGGSSYVVSWATLQEPGPDAHGGSRLGQALTIPLDFAKPNLTRVTLALEWTDDVGDPDALRLTVTSPAGQTRSGEGSSGRVTLEFAPLSPVPAGLRMLAASQDEAASRLARERTNVSATGTWNATVELLSSPGASTPVGVEVQSDGQNDWTIRSTMTTYRPGIRLG